MHIPCYTLLPMENQTRQNEVYFFPLRQEKKLHKAPVLVFEDDLQICLILGLESMFLLHFLFSQLMHFYSVFITWKDQLERGLPFGESVAENGRLAL